MIAIEKLVGEVSKELKSGSTRLVYFPLNKRKITLDGIETEIETVLKVVKPNKLEINKDKCTLGIYQNRLECKISKHKYSVFIKNFDKTFTTNYCGILSPILDNSPDFYWEEMFRVYPVIPEDFNELLKTEEYPDGLIFHEVKYCLNDYYAQIDLPKTAFYSPRMKNKYNTIISHPWVQSCASLIEEFDLQPIDFVISNFGYIIHPISYKKILVLCDYGYSTDYFNHMQTLKPSA